MTAVVAGYVVSPPYPVSRLQLAVKVMLTVVALGYIVKELMNTCDRALCVIPISRFSHLVKGATKERGDKN